MVRSARLMFAALAVLGPVTAGTARAGVITFQSTIQLQNQDPSTGLFQNIAPGTGTATAITGFSSLAGLPPSDLTFAFSGSQLLQSTVNGPDFILVYGGTAASPYTFDLLLNGSPIGTSTGATLIVVGNTATGMATVTELITLDGVVGTPFFQEVLAQTGGTGQMLIRTDPVPLSSPDNRFSTTATIATVPEPSSFALLGLGTLGVTALGRQRGRRRYELSRHIVRASPPAIRLGSQLAPRATVKGSQRRRSGY